MFLVQAEWFRWALGHYPDYAERYMVHQQGIQGAIEHYAHPERAAKYSPDLNPIEQAFSKLKALLRKAAERTIPDLCRRIGKLVAAFSASECKNYFTHAGYAST